MEQITLLVDADIVAYRFAAAAQKNYVWPDGSTSMSLEPLEGVLEQVDVWLLELQKDLKATDVIICLSCPSLEGFRMLVLPSYKSNRKDVVRPEYLTAVKTHLAENYKSYARDSLEADDVMGILSTHPKLVPGKRIIVSEDKDLQTIPGWLFNPAKDLKPRKITEEDANYYHLFQTLIGDTTDGYKGCPGIGKESAPKIIREQIKQVPYQHTFKSGPRKGQEETRWKTEKAESVWEAIVSHYEREGLTEEDALQQARVARILRACDYDFAQKGVILWTPQ